MDVENSYKGMKFDELPDIYVIFITEHDYYGRNKSIYRVRRTVEDDNSLYGDGSNILYVNGQYRDDTDIGKLMHDFCCSDPDNMLIPMLAERTRYLKTNEKEVKHMCEQMERIENRGEAKGVLKTLIQLVQDGDLSLNRAAEKAGMTTEEFLKKKEEYEKNNH